MRLIKINNPYMLCLFIFNCFFLNGFSLLGPKKAALKPDASGNIVFQLGTVSPKISEKEEYKDGKYANFDDTKLWPEVMNEAIELWQAVPGTSLQIKVQKSEKASLNSTDGLLSVVVSTDLPFSVAASAQPIKDDSQSNIKDCDIQVGQGPSPLKSLVYTVAHELGHCLGFGHNHVDYKSIMGYSSLTREFRLGLDDMAGLIYLYPAQNSANSKNTNFAPCGAIYLSKGQGPDAKYGPRLAPLLVFFLIILPLLLCASSVFNSRKDKNKLKS